MANEGEEFNRVSGLGWLNAKVIRLDPWGQDIRVPHTGWNDCIMIKGSPIFSGIPEQALFYFTHSYHMKCMDEEDISAISDHGAKFTAAVQKGNIFGTQFHPEKSQLHGLSLLQNFANKVVAAC